MEGATTPGGADPSLAPLIARLTGFSNGKPLGRGMNGYERLRDIASELALNLEDKPMQDVLASVATTPHATHGWSTFLDPEKHREISDYLATFTAWLHDRTKPKPDMKSFTGGPFGASARSSSNNAVGSVISFVEYATKALEISLPQDEKDPAYRRLLQERAKQFELAIIVLENASSSALYTLFEKRQSVRPNLDKEDEDGNLIKRDPGTPMTPEEDEALVAQIQIAGLRRAFEDEFSRSLARAMVYPLTKPKN